MDMVSGGQLTAEALVQKEIDTIFICMNHQLFCSIVANLFSERKPTSE